MEQQSSVDMSGVVGDLAPGDQGCRAFDWSRFKVSRLLATTSPDFKEAYQRLWDEFGAKGELETVEVLADRMRWDPVHARGGAHLLYELLLVRNRSGAFVAVRDHTAIVTEGAAVVHLSHVLIDPASRGTGLIGWLRACPVDTARACLRAAGAPGGPIALVAEMEPPPAEEKDAPDRVLRLKSYGKAGFLKLDPLRVDYWQPDFRPPAEIDASGGARPLPLQLVVRRVGREEERTVSGREARRLVEALYRMYGVGFRARDMAVVWEQLGRAYPADDARVALVDTLGGRR